MKKNYCLDCGEEIHSDEKYCTPCRRQMEEDYDLLEHVYGWSEEAPRFADHERSERAEQKTKLFCIHYGRRNK